MTYSIINHFLQEINFKNINSIKISKNLNQI